MRTRKGSARRTRCHPHLGMRVLGVAAADTCWPGPAREQPPTNKRESCEKRTRPGHYHQHTSSSIVTSLAANPCARSIEIVEHCTKALPKFPIARQAGGDTASIDVLRDSISRLRPMSDCGCEVGTKALIPDDLISVCDNIAQGIFGPIHLALACDARHLVLLMACYRVDTPAHCQQTLATSNRLIRLSSCVRSRPPES